MIVLALALLILVLVFSVAIVLSNPDVYPLSLFRVLVPVTSAGVFFTGFGAALVTIAALLLLRTGIRRTRETRRRLRAPDRPAAVGSADATRSPSAADPGTAADPDTRLAAARPEAQPTSSLDLDPGEDSTTWPADRQRTRDAEDRDEPRI